MRRRRPDGPADESGRFLRFVLWRRRTSFTADAFVGAVFFLVGMVPGLIAKAFFDALARHGAPWGMPAVALLLVLVGVKFVHVWLGIAWMYVDTALRGRLLALIRGNVFARLMSLPAARAVPVPVGDALNRIVEDVRQTVETLGKRNGLMNLTSSASFSVVAIAVMLTIDARVTALAVPPTVVVIAGSYLAGERASRFRARSRRSAGDVSALLAEIFSGAQAIKLGGAEEHVARRVARMNDIRRAAAVRDNVFVSALRSTSSTVLALGTGLILLVAIDPIRSGAFTIGDLALFIYLLEEMGIGVTVTGQFINQWRQARVSLARVGELQQGQPMRALIAPLGSEPPPLPAEELRELEVRRLGYDHPDGVPVFRDVSFVLTAGSMTVITGRMGVGKTTLLRCLLGMLPACHGEIRWNGEPVDDLACFMRPPLVAYTPQVPRLFSDTVRENIRLGEPASTTAETAAVRSAALEADLAELRDGLESPVGPRGYQLSGGQVQRVAAARMFLRDARLLVVDDLSSALDPETEHRLMRRLAGHAMAGNAVLMVSNRPQAIAHADAIYELEAGALVRRPDERSAHQLP